MILYIVCYKKQIPIHPKVADGSVVLKTKRRLSICDLLHNKPVSEIIVIWGCSFTLNMAFGSVFAPFFSRPSILSPQQSRYNLLAGHVSKNHAFPHALEMLFCSRDGMFNAVHKRIYLLQNVIIVVRAVCHAPLALHIDTASFSISTTATETMAEKNSHNNLALQTIRKESISRGKTGRADFGMTTSLRYLGRMRRSAYVRYKQES